MENEDIKRINEVNDKIAKLDVPISNENRQKLINKVISDYDKKTAFAKTDTKKIKKLEAQKSERINDLKSINKDPFVQGFIKKLERSKLNRKVKRIRFFPTNDQVDILRNWFGTCRYVYNDTIDMLSSNIEKPNTSVLREKYINRKNIHSDRMWMLDVPKEVRMEALTEACKNFKTNLKNVSKGQIKYFDMKFKTRKNIKHTITIPKSAIKYDNHGHKLVIYKELLGKNNSFSLSKNQGKKMVNVENIECDIKIVYQRPNYWYFYIPEFNNEKNLVTENQSCQIVSLDPGVRTFNTGYSPNGHVLEIGKNDIGRIIRLCLQIDKMKSVVDNKEIKCKKRLRILKKLNKLRCRIKNVKKDFHYKTARYLCCNYNIILVSNMNPSSMAKRGKRVINSKTVRGLLNWNHGEFRKILLEVSKEYDDCKIIVCNESYTSKTCSRCGFINRNIGGSKVFNCHGCHLVIDRDVNGARNILLRALGAPPELIIN